MKLWYQLVSPEKGMSNFIGAVQKICDDIAAPGTEVEVHGTKLGAGGDHYRVLWHFDVREVIENGLRIRRDGGYDAFVMANSLDTAIVELREILDIPVISFMEACCFQACTMGERFGLVVQNQKMTTRYREIPFGYGLRDRLAAVEAMDYAPGLNAMFTDKALADDYITKIEAAARRAIDKGAEVIILTGSPTALLASRGIYQIDGVPILNAYGLLVKSAEMAVAMHKATGTFISRKRMYHPPPSDLLRRAGTVRGMEDLLTG